MFTVIDPSFKIERASIDPRLIEEAGRVCSRARTPSRHHAITHESAEAFVERILRRGHESVVEHSLMTVRFVCSRVITHELVRHRICAFSQESQRYVDYDGRQNFVFIRPEWVNEKVLGEWEFGPVTQNSWDTRTDDIKAVMGGNPSDCGPDWCWLNQMDFAVGAYKRLREKGWRPEQAREVLPNSCKTEIVMSTNVREWRHIFRLRTAKAAHPEMRRLMIPLLAEVKGLSPALFNDLGGES